MTGSGTGTGPGTGPGPGTDHGPGPETFSASVIGNIQKNEAMPDRQA